MEILVTARENSPDNGKQGELWYKLIRVREDRGSRSRVWLLLGDRWTEQSEMDGIAGDPWNFISFNESLASLIVYVSKVRKQGRLTATVLEFVSDVWSSRRSSKSTDPRRNFPAGFPKFVTTVVRSTTCECLQHRNCSNRPRTQRSN